MLSQFLIRCVIIYRRFISPFFPPRCRFLPTCSEYAIQALQQHGAWRGGLLTIKRFSQCHPWGKSGFDPVPEHFHLSKKNQLSYRDTPQSKD
ncbi:MAG: membrane protein insertion efficiency factor YidD [Pseudomonadota bacterium]